MAEHAELVTEMPVLEKMSVQERLKHARKRRSQQLKRYSQYEKDEGKKLKKLQSTYRSSGSSHDGNKRKKRRVLFAKNIQLLEAAARGDLEEVRQLLENGVDPNIGNEDGLTALHQCCIDNNEAMMKVLVEHGADVNVTDRELWTPLHAASTCGHVNLAQYLISKGAKLLSINSDGNMPYDICEDEITLDYIESQMAAQGITQEHIDELREQAPNKMLKDMRAVYEEGGDMEKRDEVEATPLHIAAANGYDRVALFLLEHHADVHTRDKDGWQPIHAAACWAHGDMIQLLVQHGADLDSKTANEETPLTICEDEDLKGLMNQLKAEIHMKNRPSLVRRSSSRSKRGSSIRRSSKREKGVMGKKDAKGEAAFYLQSAVTPESETNGEVPSSNIDDVALVVAVDEPPSPVADGSSNFAEGEPVLENGDADHVITMPSIAETPEVTATDPHQHNGLGDDDDIQGHAPRKLKSILKRRDSGASSIDSATKKGRKSRRESKDPEVLKQEHEEKEKEKMRLKEEKEQQRLQQLEQKKRLKSERASRKEQKRIEKDEKKRKEKEQKDREKKEKENTEKRNSGQDPAEQYYTEKMDGKETLAELKRKRSSHGKHTLNRTLSDASTEGDNDPESLIAPRKDSMDMLNDISPNQSQRKRNSPNIARKLLPYRTSTGSYYLNEDGTKREGDVNGVGGDSLSASNASIAIEDPPKKKYTAVGPEMFQNNENSRCCIIM